VALLHLHQVTQQVAGNTLYQLLQAGMQGSKLAE